MSDDTFLTRWSRRKHGAKKGAAEVPAPAAAAAPAPLAPAPLPPTESLTPDSDFTPFLQKNVEEGVRRAALKTLFNDPRFNVMDGLDVYIDDFSKPDPLPEGWLEQMNQVARLGEYKAPEEEAAPEEPPESAENAPEPEAAEAPPPDAEPSDTPAGENSENAVLTPDSSGVNSDEIERWR